MPVAERLRVFREGKRLSQKEFAQLLGTPFRTYQGYESGVFTPKIAHLERLAELGCDPTWLVTGRPPARPSPDDTPLVILSHYRSPFNAGRSAERTTETAPARELTLSTDWIRHHIGRNAEDLRILYTDDDSMAPRIPRQQLLIVDRKDKRLPDGGLFALDFDGVFAVRRAQRLAQGGLLLVPDNKLYEAERLTEVANPSLHVVGRVVWHGGVPG